MADPLAVIIRFNGDPDTASKLEESRCRKARLR
jgi:hypothetical protein